MTFVTFPKHVLRDMPRPQPEYYDECARCAVHDSESEMVFDRESACWRDLKAKYEQAPPAPLESYRKIKPRVNGHPPKTLARKAQSFLKAIATGRKVSAEIFAERKETCLACPLMLGGKCSVCGCRVGAEFGKILNLAAYEENLPEWGCRHPRRAEGAGWRR